MQLTYFGGSTFRIKHQTPAHPDGEVNLVLNPRAAIKGLPKMKKSQDDIVLVSVDDKEHNDPSLYTSDAFVISSAGEYEVKSVLITAQELSKTPNTLIYRLDLENVSIGYLADAAHNDDPVIHTYLEGVDVLILPVGGKDVFSADQAIKVVSQLEPRIVIPIQYKNKNYVTSHDTPDGFVKEFGQKNVEEVTKIKITRKDLPAEERQLIVFA